MKSDYGKGPRVGWTPGYDEAWERAFGKKKDEKKKGKKHEKVQSDS